MKDLSLLRRVSLTKHTSYTSVALERTPPLEVGQCAYVNNRHFATELDKTNAGIVNMHRHSVERLDSQRKLLEKSMLAYSAKMRELSDCQTNALVRRIYTRNSVRRMKGTQSLTLPDETFQTDFIPVNSAKLRTRRRNRNLKHVDPFERYIHTPIAESQESNEIDTETKQLHRTPKLHTRRSSSANTTKRMHQQLDFVSDDVIHVNSVKINEKPRIQSDKVTEDETVLWNHPKLLIRRRSSSAGIMNKTQQPVHNNDDEVRNNKSITPRIQIDPDVDSSNVTLGSSTDITRSEIDSDQSSEILNVSYEYNSDSAYGSCTEDDVVLSVASTSLSTDSPFQSCISENSFHTLGKTQPLELKPDSSLTGGDAKCLLKVPKIHLRKRNKRNKSKIREELLKL